MRLGLLRKREILEVKLVMDCEQFKKKTYGRSCKGVTTPAKVAGNNREERLGWCKAENE